MTNPDIFELFEPARATLALLAQNPLAVVEQFATSWLEWTAVVFTLLSVIFAARQNVLTWPVGLVAVVLYGFVFWDYLLYGDMLLQGFFFITQFIGWMVWIDLVRNQTGERRGPVFWRTFWQGVRMKAFPVKQPEQRVTSLGILEFGAWVAGVFALTYASVPLMTMAGASLPFWDGLVSWGSAAAQILLIRKKWQSWVLWVSLDVLYIGVFSYKELYPSAALYGLVLLPLASFGLYSWLVQLFRQREAAVCAVPAE